MNVHVKNFQSLADVSLDVEGLTVLVGPSDLGKSALVRAIEGALFNCAGDFFVRRGATNAEVTLTGVPTTDPAKTLDIVWQKGRTKNAFIVDGAKFDKVGSSAPAPIVEAGYKDVGEDAVRPQIAGQFDRLFLLDRPGSVVASILTALSRVMVVSGADRLCAADTKATKRTETLRRTDLAKAAADVEATAGIDGLHDRTMALKREAAGLAGMQHIGEKVRLLVDRRRAVQAYLAATVLPVESPVPDLTSVAEHLRVLSDLTGRRAAVVVSGWLSVALPAPVDVPDVEAAVRRAAELRTLVGRRAEAVTRAAVTLPAATIDETRLDAAIARTRDTIDTLSRLVPERAAALQLLRLASSTASAASGEYERVEAAFDEAMAASGTCALCGQPVA